MRFQSVWVRAPCSVSFFALAELQSPERTQWVTLGLSFVCKGELTEFFTKLTEFAQKLREFSLSLLKQYSRNSIPPVPIDEKRWGPQRHFFSSVQEAKTVTTKRMASMGKKWKGPMVELLC